MKKYTAAVLREFASRDANLREKIWYVIGVLPLEEIVFDGFGENEIRSSEQWISDGIPPEVFEVHHKTLAQINATLYGTHTLQSFNGLAPADQIRTLGSSILSTDLEPQHN